MYTDLRDDAGQMRMLTDLASRNTQDVSCRELLYALSLRTGDSTAQVRWREEIRRLVGVGGKVIAVLDAVHALRGNAVESQLAAWQELGRSAVQATPDDGHAHLLLAMVAERRGDAATASRHFDTAADLDATSLTCQSARLAHYLRTGQDESARRTLGRLEADPRLSPQRFRAIVGEAVAQGGPEALTKCLPWLAAHLKREPRSAVWAGRLLESRGKLTDALALYRQTTEAHPAFADGWSARLLASAKLGDVEVKETMAGAAKSLDRKAFFGVCAECGSAVRGRMPSWAPPISNAEDRRTYAQVCLTACDARGPLEDAVPVPSSIAHDRRDAQRTSPGRNASRR